ncbi:MAG: proton-conducting transporter membrane subunit [Anaerolineales bacterium]|jgi:NADH:ubiquinone oxidoreductase subunit 2 (subunit N)|nr:proton-conducting transporter membrane subunit [Anaerolineales bacterium]
MSAPLIWIGLPLLAALALIALHPRRKPVHLAGFLIALGLALLAARLPVGQIIALRLWVGFPTLVVRETAVVLGARLTIGAALQPVIALIYAAAAFWFGGAYAARTGALFVPIGLGFCALISLALAISPALYAPLILLLAALSLLPVFSPPGQPIQRGVRRFLAYQTLGSGLVVLAHWIILTASLQPELELDLRPPVLLLVLGIGLILPIFPFHTWIPMLSEASEPYSAAFFMFLLPAANAWLALETWTQLGVAPGEFEIFAFLRLAAALMILLAGVSAAFERSLRRLLGFGLLFQVGMLLLALSLYPAQPASSIQRFVSLFIAWGAGLALWSLCLNLLIASAPQASLTDLRGLAARQPLLAAGLLAGVLSAAGLPLLAGFPVYLGLLAGLADQSPPLTWLVGVGIAALLATGARLLAQTAPAEPGSSWRLTENRVQTALIAAGLLLILALGLFPDLILRHWAGLAALGNAPFP